MAPPVPPWLHAVIPIRPSGWRRAPKAASVPAAVVAPEDEGLMARSFAGDRSARRALADRLIEPIQREVAIALTRAAAGSGQDARQEVRDLVQDVLLLLFEHDARELRRWDPARGRGLDSFVRLIARRRVARVLSQRRGNPWALVLVDDDLLSQDDGGADLVAQLEKRNELDGVLLALQARMDDRDHELFELLFVEERDPGEVATLMGLSRGAVNAWGYRMRKVARALVAAGATASSGDDTKSTGEVEHG
jgi:RNA polymerase sigma factor (sigma-70 family)